MSSSNKNNPAGLERKYNFIDLFAGCGGLSEGFYAQGFHALAHVEIDHFACETLKARMKYYGYEDAEKAVLEEDLTSKDILNKIRKAVGEQTVDIIIGGPPCQSFSPLGKAKDENNMQNDPRNYLFESYIKVLNYFKPKFFVFENVTGLLDTKVNGKSIFRMILRRLRRNYRVLGDEKTIVLNATNYGVPQERKRVILLGVRKDIDIEARDVYKAIVKTHYLPGASEESKWGLEKYVTVKDAISDLPKLQQGQGDKSVDYPNTYDSCSSYVKKIRKNSDKKLRDHVARRNNEKDVERYRVMAENHWNFLELLEYRPDLGHEKKRVFFNSYKVQWWDMPSRTIIAHLYKDGNQFIHPDPEQGRSITVREAARLQSFPDDFIFMGSRTEQFKQIGNAVPPMLAEAIAKAMRLLFVKLEQEQHMYQPIADIDQWDNAAKRYYKEKIEVFIKIVTAAAKKENISLNVQNENGAADLFIEMGYIKKADDVNLLKKIIKISSYKDFMRCGAAVAGNRRLYDPYILKLNESARKVQQKKERRSKKLRLVDLFCGAGGFSMGFIHEGCRVVFANDIDDLCIETYKYNHPEIEESQIKCGDIRKIVDKIDDYITEDTDIVIGGPPCQGFSSANKHHRVINDPRNELYKYFIQVVEKLVPKIVVMENVRGMLKVADQVVEDYEAIDAVKDGFRYHYTVDYRLLNSADFSVAQSRERLIYIAIRSDVAEQSGTTPEDIFKSIENKGKNAEVFNLSAALEGVRALEPPEVKGVSELDTEEAGRKIDANPFRGCENGYLRLINDDRVIPLVYNHKARYCSPVNHEIYRRLHPGDDATDPKIADIMPYAHRNDKFKDKYFKLHADRPCRTITAHLRSDCHSHIHPTEARALTPREAARVQSFPDDYFFLGPYLKTYIQIGNAVPPLMARGIAHELIKLIGGDGDEN